MPGSIHISATQRPATPLFLQVDVGKREYSRNIEQDGLSFPVTSLRENMVIMLYNEDRNLISKRELNTKTIVESGTMDVVFTLDSGEVVLQLQFLLNDDDRKRIQEMRNRALKRKEQELLGDCYEPNFPVLTVTRELCQTAHCPNGSLRRSPALKADKIKLCRGSPSVDSLLDKVIFSGTSVDPRMEASRDLLLQSGGGISEDPDGSKKGRGEPESKSSSAVKKMISAFESTSPQGILRPEASSSGRTEAGKTVVPFGDKGSNSYRWGKQVSFLQKPGQNGVPYPYESRSRWSSGLDGASKQKVREHELSRCLKRRSQAKHRRSIGRFSLEQLHSSSRSYLECPLNYLVATSSTWLHPHVCVTTASRELRDLLELENSSRVVGEEIAAESTCEDGGAPGGGRGGFSALLNLNRRLIIQGVRAAIVVIACGVVFLNNR